MKNNLVVAAILASIVLTVSPSFAYGASGGRISSGGFRSSTGSSTSSPSRSGGVTRSSPSRSGSYSPSYTAPRVSSPSRSYSRPYTPPPVYVEPSRPSTNVIILPDFSAPVPPIYSAPAPPAAPATPASPALPATPVAAPKPQPSTYPDARGDEARENPSLAVGLILALSVVALALIMFRSEESGTPYHSDMVYRRPDKKKVSVAKVRVALLASAKDVQSDLEKMAEDGDTDSEAGLVKIIQETSLALMRHPDLVAYASAELHQGEEEDMEALYGRLAMEERSKISDEVITNIAGKVYSDLSVKKVSKLNDYILVSLLVASESNLDVPPISSYSDLRKALVSLGSVTPEQFMALEIIWQPEGEDEVLSKDELLSLYPDLTSL